ncbi:hypothetical protein MKX01_027316 [Papaver californicum]|nr:hypothetical protein MKX01_027316 [Papaver californicum]
MDAYTPIGISGEGSFGRIWKAIDNKSVKGDDIVAIKQIKNSCLSLEECLDLTEVKALIALRDNTNIVRLRDVIKEQDELHLIFDNATLLGLMKDKIRSFRNEPELRNRLLKTKMGLFSEFEIRGWCHQIFQGLSQMHGPGGYIHRDLKMDNFQVTKDGKTIKIADFGVARQIEDQSPCSDNVTTLWHSAPEVLLNSASYNSAVDMWAMGAIMAMLYSFSHLFPGENREDQLDKICSVIGCPTQESWAEGIRLANSCCYKFPQEPVVDGLSKIIPSASREAIDLIKSLVSWDPKKRPTALEALQHPYFSPSL